MFASTDVAAMLYRKPRVIIAGVQRQRVRSPLLRSCRQPRLQMQCPALIDLFNSFRRMGQGATAEGLPDAVAQQAAAAAAARSRPEPPKRDFLEARQVSVYSLMDSDEFKFDVPLYQRPYSWRTKQVYELLQDLLTAYHAKQEYFLGAIVTTRGDNGTAAPYQLIDGQQRMTTLFIMLACLHDWAATEGQQVLQLRVRRMLFIEADPLGGTQQAGRYRLLLRGADDTFFRHNILDAFLPTPFFFAGVPAKATAADDVQGDSECSVITLGPLGEQSSSTNAPGKTGSSGAPGVQTSSGVWCASNASNSSSAVAEGHSFNRLPEALENETWWRMYENARFMRQHLQREITNGLNMQDFMFHCLRSCYLVLMTARDEEASFRIFSTLNGRGMDLSVVDKLKADLLQVLHPHERLLYSSSWAEMEGLLGRPAFHRVFDHMRALASVSHGASSAGLSVSAYFRERLGDAKVVGQLIQVALDYAGILLQLRQARWSTPALEFLDNGGSAAAAHDTAGGAATAAAVASQLAALEAQFPSTAAALHRLSVQSRYMNLFTDDAWMPAVLEFCSQCNNLDTRLKFLKAVETLQLQLELCSDAAAKMARWHSVMCTLLSSRPMNVEAVLQCVALTGEERAQFRTILNGRDYASTADVRTTKHLLLRVEELTPLHLAAVEFGSLQLEKITPQHAPDGSLWRKNKLKFAPPALAAALPTAPPAAAGPAGGQASHGLLPHTMAAAIAATGANAYDGSCTPGVAGGSAASDGAAVEVKYWHEVQRLYWHNKIGNLVLLPSAAGGASSVATAEYDAKVAFYHQCGAMADFPSFSGGLAPGRQYGQHKFSFAECCKRQADMYAKLVQIYGLQERP